MTTKIKYYLPIEVQMIWDKASQTCANPLGLTQETIDKSLEAAPPIEFKGATWIGRYLIPRQFIRYNVEEQPRDKSNDISHVNELFNNFEVEKYRLDTQPPIVCADIADLNSAKKKGLSGYHRSQALDRFCQEIYMFDVYDFESVYWEIVARNETNHFSNPQLSQTSEDYIKEVCNAVDRQIIPNDADAIDAFVDLIAKDKTAKARKKIKVTCYNNCNVFPNFRTYNSTGSGNNTLNGFIKDTMHLESQGVEGRDDQQLIAQGYITYCAGNGDNKSTWMRALYHGTRLNIPVWIFGYAPNRVDDLKSFREDFIEDFNELKEVMIQFAFNTVEEGQESVIDEDSFPVKLAGFLPQYVMPNSNDLGRPTENSLVDINGNHIKFNPNCDCLTLR